MGRITSKEYVTLNQAIDLYYEIQKKQMAGLPHSSLFKRLTDDDINAYFETLIFGVEKIINSIVDKKIKLRYNRLLVLPDKAKFIKKFSEELDDE